MTEATKPSDSSKDGESKGEIGQEPTPIDFADFLESSPPGQFRRITNLFAVGQYSTGTAYYHLAAPELQLHCSGDDCNGLRFYRYKEGDRLRDGNRNQFLNTFITYLCHNCQRRMKIFALQVFRDSDDKTGGRCFKVGEIPTYGPPTPARLIRLFQNEREIFLKGRRCEAQGLGVGAFVYYRRVVENQKDRIFGEIIRVCKTIGASAEMIKRLEEASKEIQFSKAVASVKDGIPHALFINGHNPLTLLHSALSAGLHEQSDERCLELAHDVRVVLIELAERLGQLLKDEAELNTAVTRLLNANRDDSKPKDKSPAEPAPRA